jgi:hypothetical protein
MTMGASVTARIARIAPSTTAGSVNSVCLPSVKTTRCTPALIFTAIVRAPRRPRP